MEALAHRLNDTWKGFLAFQQQASGSGGPRLSTAKPCSPAPSREFLIIRNDSQPTTGNMFLTFDSILSSSPSTQATAYESYGSLDVLMGAHASRASRTPKGMGKKSWALLKNMIPFAASSTESFRDTTRQNTVNVNHSKTSLQNKANGRLDSKVPDGREAVAFQAHSFKFSLEWSGDDRTTFGRERQLCQPQLPLSRTNSLQPSGPGEETLDHSEQRDVTAGLAKYAGASLAEWDLLIIECQDFFRRRRAEGIPNDSLVETPTLGVETFRRPG